MRKNRERSLDSLIEILKSAPVPGIVSLETVHRRLSERINGSEAVEGIVELALQQGLVDQVLECEQDATGLNELTWHLKLLTPEEQQRMRSLRPVAKALLWMLRCESGPTNPGEMPVAEAHKRLSSEGFSPEDVETVEYSVNGLVDTYLGFKGDSDESVWWYRLVPEFERHPTSEYLEMQRAIEEEFLEKELRREEFLEEMEREEERHDRRHRVRPRRKNAADC
jgi:hypothetical protein